MRSRGVETDIHEVLSAVLERDRIDSTRDVAPLRVAFTALPLSPAVDRASASIFE